MFIYVIYEVEDVGGPESGPQIREYPIWVQARNAKIAQRKFRRMPKYRKVKIDESDRLKGNALKEYLEYMRGEVLERLFNPSYFGPYTNPYYIG